MSEIKLSPQHGLNSTIPICFWCGKEKNEIALLGKIDKEDSPAPRKIVVNYEPCDACKELFSKGIHVIGCSKTPMVETMFPIMEDDKCCLYPTGSMFVAPEEWIKDFLTQNEREDMIENVLEMKVLLIPDDIVNQIIKDSNAEEMEVELEDNANENN